MCRNANGHVLLASGGGGTVQLWDRVPVGNTNAATICQERPASISVRHALGEVPDDRKQRDTVLRRASVSGRFSTPVAHSYLFCTPRLPVADVPPTAQIRRLGARSAWRPHH